MAASKDPRCGSRVRIEVVSLRHRLTDPDGISAKAAIDACVDRGLLGDDSAKYVEAIAYRQIKVTKEQPEATYLVFIPEEPSDA